MLVDVVTPKQFERLSGILAKRCWCCGAQAEVCLGSSCARCSDIICHANVQWIPIVGWNRRMK